MRISFNSFEYKQMNFENNQTYITNIFKQIFLQQNLKLFGHERDLKAIKNQLHIYILHSD